MSEEMPEGIYFGLPEDDYHAAPGLSNSGIKHLFVSPLNYWHHNLNPEYERPEETSFQRFGKAVHCRLLEPKRYDEEYAVHLNKDDFADALDTVEEMKAWLKARELPVTAKNKEAYIERILEADPDVLIWERLKASHAEAHAGKAFISADEGKLLKSLSAVVDADPYASKTLSGGIAEVSFFVRCPETGVMLKARMDYVKPHATIDLKTFGNSRSKPVSKAVHESIYYEGYYMQCVFYSQIRELARQKLAAGEIQTFGNVSEEWLKGFTEAEIHGFGFVFAESDPPHDLRIIQMKEREAIGGQANIYWTTAAYKIAEAKTMYAEWFDRCGYSEWREPAKPYVLSDMDLPQLMFN